MQLKEAIALIDHEKFKSARAQSWYDLGAGTGIFTVALAHSLIAGSKIVAIDNDAASLRQIPGNINNTNIETLKQDFTRTDLPYNDFDGILMANSFHYVKNKIELIQKIRTNLKPVHSFLIVEYDTERSNTWVPYPISFLSLQELLKNAGYGSVIKLNETASRYRSNMMYAAMIEPGFA
jgi:ubiquinone/menaquinone biosynthesis C-methylase UbiE